MAKIPDMISLSGLNAKQREAAEAIEGPVLILAGAGSGKTRTLTYRIAHMVDNLCIPAQQILAVSFTNKAAREMKERMHALLGASKCQGMTLSTFHSLGVKILKEDITKLGYDKFFSIYDTSDQIAIVRDCVKRYKSDKKFDQKQILSKIGWLKNHGITPEDFQKSNYFDEDDAYDLITEHVYFEYQEKLKFFNAIDFDDILFLCVRLFNEHPDVKEKWSRRFRYIMIDEYQDTNGLQFQMVLGLTSTHNNLCVVGDDDQSIYGFRGADISNILSFDKNFPGAKVVKLEQNYRSTNTILNLANQVIKENKDRREKTLWSEKESPNKPLLWLMADTDHEAAVVVEDIVQHQSAGKSLSEVAILYRSNTQTQAFEDELRLSQVPYTVFGGQKYYEKKEVKDLIAYMSVILNPHDQMSLRRILNVPARGIGMGTLSKYIEKTNTEKISLFSALEKYPDLDPKREKHIRPFVEIIRRYQKTFHAVSLAEAINKLISDLDYINWVTKQYDGANQAERRKNDVLMFVESAERFSRHFKNPTLRDFVEKLLLQDAQDDDSEEDQGPKNEVTLMTLHSSKGLEFDRVYFVGMEEEIIPHKRTIALGEDISEERRLCYVGITRAREQLIMSQCKQRRLYGKDNPCFRSRFLNDLEDLFVEQDRTCFGHMTREEADKYKQDFFSDLKGLLE